MPKEPLVDFKTNFVGVEQAYAKVKSIIANRPIGVKLVSDAKSLNDLDKGLGKLSGRADEFTKSLEAANARVLAFGASVAVISAIQRGFLNLVKSTIEVEAAFKKISVVGDQFAATAGQLEKFGRGIFDVARQTGQSFDETSKAALEFARQGLSAADTLVRVKDALTLTRLSGLDATSSVEGLTAAVNSFKKEGLSTTDVLNKLIAVDNKYAVSSGDLIEAIKRSGSFAQEAGVSFDELTATVTVLQEATARGGSVIGNSLKTIFERVGRPESIKQLRALNVEVEDVGGKILPAIKIVDNFANKLGEMDETAKRTALRQLAGTLQINQLSALTNALKEAEGASRRYDDVLSTSANASIEATTANNKLNESLDAQIKALLATGTQLGSLFGNIAVAPILKDVVDSLGGFGKTLVDELSSEGPNITKAFANVIGDAILAAGVAGTLSIGLILKKFAIFAKESFSNILGINSAAKNQEAIQLSILNTLRTRSDVEAAILSAGNSEIAQASVLAKIYNDIANANARHLATSKALSQIISPSFVIGSSGIPVPRGKKGANAASGYVPDLIQAEYSDIKKGTGGANKNAGVVLINDFPFGPGKKGPMVANTSEGILPMGNSAAVLNRDMLDKMGYGKRAAQGDIPSLSLASTTVANKSGKFLSVNKLEKIVESTAKALGEQNVAGIKFTNAINKAIKDAGFDLTGKSLREIGTAAVKFSKELKAYDAAIKEAYELAIQENAQKRKLQAEAKKLLDVQRAENTINSSPQKRASSADPSVLSGKKSLLFFPPDSSQKIFNFVDGYFEEFQKSADKSIELVTRNVRSTTRFRGAGNLPEPNLIRQNEPLKPISREDVLRQVGGLLGRPDVSTLPKPNLFTSTLSGTSFEENRLIQRRKNQTDLKELLLAKRGFSSGGLPIDPNLLPANMRSLLAGPGDKLRRTDRFGVSDRDLAIEEVSRNLSELTPEIIRAKKTFSEVAIDFGTQAGSIFLGASVVKNTFESLGVEAGKLTDTVRDSIIGFVALKKINEFNGKNGRTGSLLDALLGSDFKKGRALSRRSGPLSNAEMDFLGQSSGASRGFKTQNLLQGVSSFGSKLLGVVPVLGQLATGLFVANSVLSYFGVDAWDSIKRFVTGLSSEGEKAKESLKVFSESLFENGKFIGKSQEEAFRGIQTRMQEQRELVRARNFNVQTKGKSADQIASENFVKELEKSLSNLKIGGREQTFRVQQSVGSIGGFTQSIPTGFRDKLFSDLDRSTKQIVLDSVAEIFALNIEELKSIAKQRGIKTSGKESRGELASLVSQAAVEAAKRAGTLDLIGKDLSGFGTTGTSTFQRQIGSFINPQRVLRQENQARNPELFTNVNIVKAQVAAAIELKKLQLDFSNESERALETKIRTAQISEIEKTNLQVILDNLKLERALRADIFDIAAKGIDKVTNSDGFGDLEKSNLKASVKTITELGLGIEDTKTKLLEVFNTLSGDVVTDNIRDEIFGQLDGIQKINEEKRKQLSIQSEQLKNETRISENFRLQQSLLASRSDIRSARIGLNKASIESSISGLDAQSNSPNLSIEQQNALRRQGNILKIESLELDKRIAESEKKAAEDALRLNGERLTSEERQNEQKKIDLNFQKTNESINAQIEALKIQGSQIAESASAMTLLANAAFQFKQNLGEIESSNILSTLRAVDFSSLGSSLASQQAFSDLGSSGKTGLDAEQFLAERTALRQKEFEIASATSKVQKLQLTQEKQLLEDIFAAKKSGEAPDQLIANLIDLQNKRLKEQRSLRSGINNARAQIQDDIDSFGSSFGETATLGFRDSLSEALKAAANGTGDLKNALLDVALSFANKLRDAAIDNLANLATNSLFKSGGESGGNLISSLIGGLVGGVKGYASGGRVTGGSGSKDDVPTMLMGGEYVVNKKSVQKYGPQFFDALNNGQIRGMASGGFFSPGVSGQAITGASNLKKFASQSFTSGSTDKILSFGRGAAALELEPESLRLTNFARQSGNPLQSATQEVKDQALALVFQDQELQKQYRDQLDAIKKAEKEKQKQLLVSLAIAAIGSGVSGAFSGGQASSLGSTNMSGGRSVGDRPFGLSATSSSLSNRSVIRSTSSASNLSAGITRAISSGNLPSGGFDINSYNNPLFNVRRASGGAVNGNGYGDNVPTMLSGGEFVINRKAARTMGLANLNAANSGKSMGLSEEKSEELNNRLIDKLDELVEKLSSSNNVVVNVSMDKDGKSTSTETSSQTEDQRNLNRRIKDAVVQILQEEKRLGGVLRK